jgi:TonB family protein
MIVPAAVGLVAFLGVAYVAAAWFDRSPSVPRHAETAEDDLPMSGPPPAEAQPAAPAASSPAVASRPDRSTATPRERPDGRPVSLPAVAPPAAATTQAPAAPPSNPVDVVVSEGAGRVVASPIAPVPPAARASAPGRVFQAGDPHVTPAVLIRPRLPDHPPADVPDEQIGTLEFIVTETGTVEHVHLVSPTNRYQERMLVAAAKAWQFQPATRDGRPVRFRTRIRVTL